MPPWPGLPDNPRAEGHYLYINKNLIEMLALLALATTRSGRWAGLDALFAYCCTGKKATEDRLGEPGALAPGGPVQEQPIRKDAPSDSVHQTPGADAPGSPVAATSSPATDAGAPSEENAKPEREASTIIYSQKEE
jgi:hypothetical protein